MSSWGDVEADNITADTITSNTISSHNINLVDNTSNILHTGLDKLVINSINGQINIGHPGMTMLLQGNITIDGELDGATGLPGPQGPIGYTGPIGRDGLATNTGSTGNTGPTGSSAPYAPSNLLARKNSTVQTIKDATFTKVLFDSIDTINYMGIVDLTYSESNYGSVFTNTTELTIQLQINYQVSYTGNIDTSGDNVRIASITINDTDYLATPGNNRYGLVSMQAQLYGTSCQGNCIITLHPNDYFEVWTKQNSGVAQEIGGSIANINYTNRIQIVKLGIGPTGIAGSFAGKGDIGDTGPTGKMGLLGQVGPKGNDGTATNTGASGPTGHTGPIGRDGSATLTGATGPTGPPAIASSSNLLSLKIQ